MTCAGSVAACVGIEQESSIYADEGTAAHAVGSALLKGEVCTEVLAKFKTFFQLEADYIDALNYVDSYVLAIRNAAEGKILLIEQSLPMEKWTSEFGGTGTADAIIVDPKTMTIEVWDLKFGQGNVVWATGNPQTRLYALGALDLVEMIYGKVNSVKLMIFQPRRDHADYEVLTREDLLKFGVEAHESGYFALSLIGQLPEVIEANLHPTAEGCLFCPKAPTCPARAKQVQDSVFESFTVVEPGKLQAITKPINSIDWQTDEELTLIEDWCKARREYIYAQLRSGAVNSEWKLTLGRQGHRKFTDEARVVKLLKSLKFKKEQIFEQSLISLPKIEKMVPKPKWPVFEALISRNPAQPIAVSSADPRPAYDPKMTADQFENVEEVNLDAFK
jgi:hypothetical protein